MNTKAKKPLYRRINKLDVYLDQLRLSDLMSNDEYLWLHDHLMNLVSSIGNFETTDGYYDNPVEAREASQDYDIDEEELQ